MQLSRMSSIGAQRYGPVLVFAASLWLTACAARMPETARADEIDTPAVVPALRGHGGALPLVDTDGSPTDLRNLAAPVTVVTLWATRCPPCIEKLPAMEALHRRYADDPSIRFLMVSVDGAANHARARALLTERAPTLAAYFDVDGWVQDWAWPKDKKGRSIQILPLTAVIDAEGAIHRRVSIEKDRSGSDLVDVIDGALRGSMPPSLPDIFKQMNPSLPSARPGSAMSFAADLSPKQIADALEQVRSTYHQDPDFTDELIEQRLDEMRRRIEAGERYLELDFSKPESQRSE